MTDLCHDLCDLRAVDLVDGEVDILGAARARTLGCDSPPVGPLAGPLTTCFATVARLTRLVFDETRLTRVAGTVWTADLVLEGVKESFGKEEFTAFDDKVGVRWRVRWERHELLADEMEGRKPGFIYHPPVRHINNQPIESLPIQEDLENDSEKWSS